MCRSTPAGDPGLAFDRPRGSAAGIKKAGLLAPASTANLFNDSIQWTPGHLDTQYSSCSGRDSHSCKSLWEYLACCAPACRDNLQLKPMTGCEEMIVAIRWSCSKRVRKRTGEEECQEMSWSGQWDLSPQQEQLPKQTACHWDVAEEAGHLLQCYDIHRTCSALHSLHPPARHSIFVVRQGNCICRWFCSGV